MTHINDLTENELRSLYDEIKIGSIFVDDYENSFGVPFREVHAASESFRLWCNETGEDINAENYANYVYYQDFNQ